MSAATVSTRYFAVARDLETKRVHRLAQTANGSIRYVTAQDVALRTFARDDLDRVRDFCMKRGMRLERWRAIDPYPWLEVDPDTRLPHPKLARILNEAGRRCGRKLRINEGTRTRARQQQLWDANPNPRFVARPGTSRHEDLDGDGWGIAADVVDALDGENLRPMLERRDLLGWFAQQGAHFPMSWEPWHTELAK